MVALPDNINLFLKKVGGQINKFGDDKTCCVCKKRNEKSFFPSDMAYKPIAHCFCNYNEYLHYIQVKIGIKPNNINCRPGNNIYKKANYQCVFSFTLTKEKTNNGQFCQNNKEQIER